MTRITILSIGKTKERWLQEALAVYVARLNPHLHLDFSLVAQDRQLEKRLQSASLAIALAPQGETLTSLAFASRLDQWLIASGSHLTFVIGGPDGLPTTLRKLPSISLSSLTYTHQLARLVLVEQLYRAIQIKLRTPYHR